MVPDPQFIKPILLAEQGEILAGKLQINALQRLTNLLCNNKGMVDFRLDFNNNEQGFVSIVGEFRVTLELACQRCLQPFVIPLQNGISIGIVASKDEADHLPGNYEPLILTTDQIPLLTLIEDEILLALPIAPAHEIDQCPATESTEKSSINKRNPFAELKDLKLAGSKD